MHLTHFFPVAAVSVLVTAAWTSRSLAAEPRFYEIESAVVEFKLSGTLTGKETLYFDRWGMREAKYEQTELKVAGQNSKANMLTLRDGEWTYVVVLDKKIGIKGPTVDLVPEIKEALKRGNKSLVDFRKEMPIHMGGKKVGEENLLGKPCEVWEIHRLGMKLWIWKGVTLKETVDFSGQKSVKEAVSIDHKAKIPDGKLTVPSGVKITEIPTQSPKRVKKKSRP